jgi:general secretion pathway protein G
MEVMRMIKSKHSRNAVAAWFLVLLSYVGVVRAEISPRSKGDELLQILPAESLFCVRVNNLDRTLNTVDQFLTGSLFKSSDVSNLVRMQFAKMLGSPELNGVNMEGNYALFGVTTAGKPPGPKPSDMFIGALVPITDYKQFIEGNPNLSPPDANGVSKNTSSEFGEMLIKQVGNYALIGPDKSGTFDATAKWISVKSVNLGSVLDAIEAQRAVKEPLWGYGNIQQVSKSFGPLLSGQLDQMKKMVQSMESSKQGSMGPTVKIIDIYVAIFETLMNETKSLSLTVRPRPNVCNLTVSVSAVPGTAMANMFAADTYSGKENRLLGYLEDGAMMNFAGKMNTPLWKKMNLKSIGLLTSIAGENMTAEDITKMKRLAEDGISALGGAVAFSFFIDANSKPPFVFKYILEVKDSDKFNKVLDEASETMNAGGIADFYKSLGIEMGFTIKRGVGSYKGVSIDSAKFVMRSTDPNLPQGQMIDAMYGGGIEYRLAIADGLFVSTIGGDVDSAIRKLIDEVKAGGPKQMAAEMKAALALLPEADTADFMGTYNFLRLFSTMGAMGGAFMPVPTPIAQMDIATRSNIAFAGKASNGRMTVDIALPKEHLTEIVRAFQSSSDTASSLSELIESAENLSMIGKALLIYANDYEDQYPPNLQVLVETGYIKRPEILESPRKPKDFDGPGYIYIAGQSTTRSEPGNIIVYENPEFCSDKINVLFIDTHVAAMKPVEFPEKLQATYKQLGREMPEIKFKSPTRNESLKMRQPTMQPQRTQESRVIITKANLRILHTAVLQFKMDTGRFPTEEEGLTALIEKPADVKVLWEPGGYLNTTKIPKDGWGNDFIYDLYPESDKPFVIISLGADGEEGGEGHDADLFSTDR